MHLRGPEAAERMQRELAAYLALPDGCRWLSRPGVTLPWWQGWVSVERGFPLTQLGRYSEAEDAYEQASALWTAGTGRSPWTATVWLPVILYLQGKYVQARQYALQSLNAFQTGASRGRSGEPLAFLAEIEAATGEIALAREHYRRSLAIARTLDRHGLVCFCLEGAGRLELDIGRPAKAVELYRESLAFADRAGMAMDSHVVVALVGLGRAALAMGERGQAERHLRHALRCPLYYMHDRIEAVTTLAQVFAQEGDVLRAVELLAFAVAHPATAHRVRQPMSRLLAELEAELPADQFAAAVARGRARAIDDVVAELAGIAQEPAPTQV
jgi:tetratricopeptide (TPR) repeat protein